MSSYLVLVRCTSPTILEKQSNACWKGKLPISYEADGSLDGVIRAYVHTDYSSYNPPQHTSRKQRQPSTSGNKLALTPSRLSDTADDISAGSITPTNNR